jgi:penicillin amidase
MYKATKRVFTLIVVMLVLSIVPVTAAGPPGDRGSPRGQVTIIRDEYGVPHVFGSTPESLWYGVGYAQGQDRLWQADLLRRTVNGTSAEFFGPGALAGDIAARTMWGPADWRAELLAGASPETQLIFEWFAVGMNAWIEEATQTGQLPVEYGALGLSPEPWAPEDSVAVVMLIFGQFGESGADELANYAHLEELFARFGPEEGAKVFQDTHWLDDPDAATTVPAEGAINPARRSAAPKTDLPPGVGQGYNQWNALRRGWERNLERLGIGDEPASNAIVVGPHMTADGRALLLGGPQMGHSTPQISLEMGAHQGNFHATGITFAGMPGIAIGVTENFAWSFTSGVSDNSDIYVEVLNPEDPGQYLFQGAWLDLECRVETILVRGGDDANLPVCKSVHGPVVGTAPGLAFTLKAASRGHEIESVEALLAAQQARTIDEIDRAMAGWAPNFNMFVADVRGNIAYWHLGKIPIRAPTDNPWLPHDGTGVAEWQGFVPWEEMPRALNPDQGWIANWNNKPAPGWHNANFGFGGWGPVHRVDALFSRLEGLEPGTITVETLEEVNRLAGWTTDTPSGSAGPVFVPGLLDDMLAHVNTAADPRLPDVVALLSAWDWLQVDADLDGTYDNPSVTIFNTWCSSFAGRVFADDLGADFEPIVIGNLTHRLLDDEPVLPLLYDDYLGGETPEEAVTGALIDTLDALTVGYGSLDPADWLQPIAQIVWAPLGIGSVPNTIYMNRGTYNQIVHLGSGPELYGENVVAPGQSGDPFGLHFADQLELYATWTYKPMRLNRADLVGHIESTTRLKP